jgi:hypothetical protein
MLIPHWPAFSNFRFVPKSVSVPFKKAKRLPAISEAGGFCPVNSVSRGLSSKRSSWEGPPAMNM